ncbi:pirin family protein [Pseudomonas sp. NPDC090755]|uniref:pirin family protein n=1 Tax=Pseudomonas sp. NPDC090755 TaxID=3364481 RepID=UPI00383B9BF7
MSVIASLQRANHGSHFRDDGLRGVAELIDPFLGVDHAWMSGPTFPPHPHVGFSAVSYLFLDSETGINNRDDIGTQSLIRPGGLHWTAAGRVSLEEGAELTVPIGHCAFVMPIFGATTVNGQRFDLNDLKLPVFPARATPCVITLQAPHGSTKVTLFAGQPLQSTAA